MKECSPWGLLFSLPTPVLVVSYLRYRELDTSTRAPTTARLLACVRVYTEAMALTVKNPEVERLAEEVARLAGETKTEAIRKALLERKARLARPERSRSELVEEFLREMHDLLPKGRRPTKAEEEEILGFGPEGL